MNPIRIVKQRDYQAAVKNFLAKQEVQAYTMAILSFFALAFFSVFAIRPTLISFFTLRKQIVDSRRIEGQLDGKINSLLKAQGEYQKNQAGIELLTTALPPDPQFPELVKKIESVVTEEEATMSAFSTNGFSLLKEKGQPDKSTTDLNTIDFAFTINPDYKRNESVLERLLSLRRVITISLLNFAVNTTDKDQTVRSTINAKAYYSREKDTFKP